MISTHSHSWGGRYLPEWRQIVMNGSGIIIASGRHDGEKKYLTGELKCPIAMIDLHQVLAI